jgi:hypothetical protein
MAPDGYERMPFTHDDATRWLSQGGWLTFGPKAQATAREMGRRFRRDGSDLMVRLEGTDLWYKYELHLCAVTDQFVPIPPEGFVETKAAVSKSRFDIIEDF